MSTIDTYLAAPLCFLNGLTCLNLNDCWDMAANETGGIAVTIGNPIAKEKCPILPQGGPKIV